jgi:hypothetical protein
MEIQSHGHAHPHGHRHGTLGAVPVLDIGDGVGAVVAYLHHDTPSGEIDICPVGDVEARFHTGVHERGDHYIAVFAEVREGSYDLLDPVLAPIARVDVKSGEVAEVHL